MFGSQFLDNDSADFKKVYNFRIVIQVFHSLFSEPLETFLFPDPKMRSKWTCRHLCITYMAYVVLLSHSRRTCECMPVIASIIDDSHSRTSDVAFRTAPAIDGLSCLLGCPCDVLWSQSHFHINCKTLLLCSDDKLTSAVLCGSSTSVFADLYFVRCFWWKLWRWRMRWVLDCNSVIIVIGRRWIGLV